MIGIEIDGYNSFVTKKGNTVWAAAMCLAWSELIKQFVKEPISLDVKDFEAKKIIANYNAERITLKDISSQSVYVKSGKGQNTVDRINQEVFKKFPEKTMQKLDVKLNPDDIIAYAYLFKRLIFETKFQKKLKHDFLFKQTKVASFFAENKQQKQQIRCFQYKNRENFTIFLKGKNKNDLIYLIKSQKQLTIDEAIKHVLLHTPQIHCQKLGKQDYFQMPIVDLSCKRQVTQLMNKFFLNQSMKGYLIRQMYEGLKIKIDEEGARVQNEAVIMTLRCAVFNQSEPKVCALDKDFWIVMRQQNKHPYLCIHINDPEDKD